MTRYRFAFRLIPLFVLLTTVVSCTPPTANSVVTSGPVQSTSEPAVTEDEGELIEESWDLMLLQGAKVGHSRTTRRRVKSAGEERIRTEAEQVLTIKRYDQTTEQTIRYRTEETASGKLFSAWAALTGGNMAMETNGVVRDGMLELKVVTQGKSQSSSLPWSDDKLGFFGLEDSLRRAPLKPGEKRNIQWFQPLLNVMADDQIEALAEEDVALLDGSKRLLKLVSTAKLGGQAIESTFWADDAGVIWKTSRPAMGQEVYRTTKEVALKKGTGSFDLGWAGVVRISRPLAGVTKHDRAVYRARMKDGDPSTAFLDCPSQTVKKTSDHIAEITVRRIVPRHPEKITPPAARPLDADLQPNNLVQSDDANVVKFATSVVPSETDKWTIATALEKTVHDRMSKQNFSQAFATAAETAKSLEGDCTEHAVLLAAACRARGIPARVAAGLVYFPPRQGFAYHMWSEVWIDDRWVPLDATLGRGGIGGGHLKLFDSNLEGADAFTAFLPVANVLGRLELEVVEAE